jgi:hypothetical protein
MRPRSYRSLRGLSHLRMLVPIVPLAGLKFECCVYTCEYHKSELHLGQLTKILPAMFSVMRAILPWLVLARHVSSAYRRATTARSIFVVVASGYQFERTSSLTHLCMTWCKFVEWSIVGIRAVWSHLQKKQPIGGSLRSVDLNGWKAPMLVMVHNGSAVAAVIQYACLAGFV